MNLLHSRIKTAETEIEQRTDDITRLSIETEERHASKEKRILEEKPVPEEIRVLDTEEIQKEKVRTGGCQEY